MASMLKAERERRGLTQEDLARMSGVSRQTINYLENGRQRPYAKTLERLSAALGVDPNELAVDGVAVRKQPSRYILRSTAPQDELVHGLLRAVQEGEMSAEDAMSTLRAAGVLQPRRKTKVSAAAEMEESRTNT
jgi:transcriptional regulator with XRE-family HTH domain